MTDEPQFGHTLVRDKKTGEIHILPVGKMKDAPTPLAPLLAETSKCVGMCVPERHPELQQYFDSGIRTRLHMDRGDFYIAANVEEKRVILGLAALERIWAHVYFYLTIGDLLPKYQKGEPINLFELPETKPARDLVLWAQGCEMNKQQSPWPEGLPRPDWDAAQDERITPVRMHFLHAMCFLVLHEFAHIILQHPMEPDVDSGTSYRCEHEADQWAADFMLGDWRARNRGDLDFTGRCTGVALGLSLLAGVELNHRGSPDTHPTVAERLMKFFARYDPKSVGEPSAIRDYPLYLASVVIQWHLQSSGTPFDLTRVYGDTTDYLIEVHRAMMEHRSH